MPDAMFRIWSSDAKMIRSFVNNQKGAAGAEMALVLPLLITLMFGAFELGHYFWNEHIVIKSVRDGSRFAARQPFSKYSCNSTNLADTALKDKIADLTVTGDVGGLTTPKVRGWAVSDVTVTVSCPQTALTTGIYNAVPNAPRVTVATTFSYPSLFERLGFDSFQLNLAAQAQAPVVGF